MNYYEVTAVGRGTFPLDMLRFGRMFPKDIESTLAMEFSNDALVGYGEKAGPQREATFCLHGSYMQAHAVVQRFASFGWIAEITHEDKS